MTDGPRDGASGAATRAATVNAAPDLAEGSDRASQSISLRALFWMFFKSGLAFGGGIGIVSELEADLVEKRRAMTRQDFLAIYGIGRVVPSGTMTAMAVACGYRFHKLPGTFVTLVAMILPSFVLTMGLTVAYVQLHGSPFFDLLTATLVPAALALILVSAIRLGQDMFHPSIELLLGAAAITGVVVFGINPSILIVVGGLIGAFTIRGDRRKKA